MAKIIVKLLAALIQRVGVRELEVDAENWREALKIVRDEKEALRDVIAPDGTPKPGYIVFVDGIDYRLYDGTTPKEIVILPVIHGGEEIDIEMVDWETIDKGAGIIASKILQSGFKPDIIVGILRGGIIPARIIADKLGVDDLTTMEIKLYKSRGIRGDRPYLRQPPLLPLTNKKILIIDDVSDSGLTLQLAVEASNLFMPGEIRTASIYIKPWTKFVPDYYAYTTEAWIVFPWERGEFEREE